MNLSDPNTGTTYYIHDLFDELGGEKRTVEELARDTEAWSGRWLLTPQLVMLTLLV